MHLPASLRTPRLAVVVTTLALFGAHSVLADDNGAWRGIAPAPGRSEHVAAYDAVNDRLIVVLGQYFESELQPVERDVWTRSFSPFGGWQEMIPAASGPSGFLPFGFGPVNGQMVYDSSRNRFVMATDSTLTMLDPSGGGAWATAKIVGTPPSDLFHTSAIYDPGADRIVYFGGDGPDSLVNDVWTVNLSGTPTWLHLTPSGPQPPGRSSASAVYDPTGTRMIVFGGDENEYRPVPGVWALSLTGPPVWTDITPSAPGPDDRSEAAVMIDPVRHRMLLQGGTTNDAELWALDLGATPTWSIVATAGPGPGKLWNHTMSYDSQRDRLLLYGGAQEASYPSGKLLALDLGSGTWSDLSDIEPTPRHAHTAVYDAPRQRMIVFGGISGFGVSVAETWSLSLGAQQVWTNLLPSGSPPTFEYHTAIVDPVRQRMLAYSAYPTGDVWSFDLAGAPAWTRLSTAGTSPGYRSQHVAIYDPNGDRMIICGGSGSSDVWQLTLSGTPTWTQLFPTGTAPPGLFRPCAIYDPVGARMLIVGANSPQGFRAKVWSLSLTGPPAWQLLAPTGTGPQDCGSSAAVYDDSRQRMLVFSGGAGCNSNSTSTYALSLGGGPLQWTVLTPVNPRPVIRCGPSAIYDSAGDRMVIYGGEWCNGLDYDVDMDSAWSLAFGSTVSTPLPVLPADVELFPVIPNPASGDVTLAFALPHTANAQLVIYDLAGRKCAELLSGQLTAGRHEVRWSRSARDAAHLGAGVYFCELKVGDRKTARRVVVTR